MIEFARPWVLFLLPVVLLLGFLSRTRPQDLPQFLGGLVGGESGRALPEHLRTGLRLATLTVLVLALAAPESWTIRALEEEGIAMVLALDLSGSMGRPVAGGQTRLDAAKRELRKFIESRPNDVIGLVTFGEEAITRVPPTSDHQHLLQVVRTLVVGASDEGTALGLGVGLAAFTVQGVDLPSRVVTVLSDGRGNRGSVNPLSAAEAGRTVGVTVHAVGLGGEGGPDPMDERAMRAVAERGGGRFYRSDETNGLAQVLGEIRSMEQSPHSTLQVRAAIPLHRPLLWTGWALILLELLVGGRPLGRKP